MKGNIVLVLLGLCIDAAVGFTSPQTSLLHASKFASGHRHPVLDNRNHLPQRSPPSSIRQPDTSLNFMFRKATVTLTGFALVKHWLFKDTMAMALFKQWLVVSAVSVPFTIKEPNAALSAAVGGLSVSMVFLFLVHKTSPVGAALCLLSALGFGTTGLVSYVVNAPVQKKGGKQVRVAASAENELTKLDMQGRILVELAISAIVTVVTIPFLLVLRAQPNFGFFAKFGAAVTGLGSCMQLGLLGFHLNRNMIYGRNRDRTRFRDSKFFLFNVVRAPSLLGMALVFAGSALCALSAIKGWARTITLVTFASEMFITWKLAQLAGPHLDRKYRGQYKYEMYKNRVPYVFLPFVY